MDELQHPASAPNPPEQQGYSVYLPLLLAGLSLVLMLGFQTSQLLSNQDKLNQLKATLVDAVEKAQMLRTQFDGLARKTVELAANGNDNARYVIDEMKKQGVDLSALAAAPAPAGKDGNGDAKAGGGKATD